MMRPLTLDLPRLEAALLGGETVEHYLDLDSGAIFAQPLGEPPPAPWRNTRCSPSATCPSRR